LFSLVSGSLTAQGRDLPFFTQEHGCKIIITQQKTFRLYYTAEHLNVIFSQLFAGHVVGCQPMERKKKLYQMILLVVSVEYR